MAITIKKLQENIRKNNCFFAGKNGNNVIVEEKEDGTGRHFLFSYNRYDEDVSVEIRAGVIDEIPYGEQAGFIVDKATFLSLSDEMFDNFIGMAIANISVRETIKSAS